MKKYVGGFLLLLIAVGAHAQENCGFPVSLLRSGFEAGEQPSVAVLPPESTPVSIAIVGPANGAVTGVASTQVFGTYLGPANTGISVNDVPAIVNGSAFVSPRIPLTVGVNTLTIRYATLDQDR